MELILLFLLYL